ncbi:MAG TPA: hypothetical protein VN783_17595 [Thermoanaerobaculia bacterium]|nr:hypothetical protein [Thermoanaerobaculia bacterium]
MSPTRRTLLALSLVALLAAPALPSAAAAKHRYVHVLTGDAATQTALAKEKSALAKSGAARGLTALRSGTGYVPRSSQVSYRAFPGGPLLHTHGDLSADPWSLSGVDPHSRFLDCNRADVRSAWVKRYGLPEGSCGPPGGGFAGGPSGESRFDAPMEQLCAERPDLLPGSPGPAVVDCRVLAREVVDLGAFDGGWLVATAYAAWANPTPPDPIHPPAGETCVEIPLPPVPPGVLRIRPGLSSTGAATQTLVSCRPN